MLAANIATKHECEGGARASELLDSLENNTVNDNNNNNNNNNYHCHCQK